MLLSNIYNTEITIDIFLKLIISQLFLPELQMFMALVNNYTELYQEQCYTLD